MKFLTFIILAVLTLTSCGEVHDEYSASNASLQYIAKQRKQRRDDSILYTIQIQRVKDSIQFTQELDSLRHPKVN